MNTLKAFWIFLIGSFTGFLSETITCLIGMGSYQWRSSLMLMPLTVVYGFAAVCLYYGTRIASKNNILRMYLFGVAASTVIEYAASVLQEKIFNSVSWDYSGYPLNINGRVCFLYSLFWGFLAILWYKYIQPFLEKMISRLPSNIFKPLTYILFVFVVFNVVVSSIAVIRWGMRLDGIPAVGTMAEALDRLLPNDVMTKFYPNMRW